MAMGDQGREIRLAIIGLGSRGIGQMQTLLQMPDVKAAVVCDVYEDRVQDAQNEAEKLQGFRPDGTLDYVEAINRDDIEAVIIMTSWTTHITIALEALHAGKRVAMEVGGAASLEECWALVRESERTGIPVMLLENCCYNSVEMAMLNMIRQGVFGELIHCQGGYEHDLRDEIGEADLVFDSVGSTLQESVMMLKPGGAVVALGGTENQGVVEDFDIRTLYLAHKRVLGTAMGSPRDFAGLLDMVEDGSIDPVIDSVYPLDEAAEAHAQLDSNRRFGKIVLSTD